MKQLLRVSVLAFLGALALFAALGVALSPALLAPVAGDGWTADLPRFGTHHAWERNGWTARQVAFATSVTIAVRPMDGPADAEVAAAARDARGARTVEDVAIPQAGARFVLSGGGKCWDATLLVPAGGRLFWIAAETRGSNAAESMSVVSRVAASLRLADADGPALAPDARAAVDAVVVAAVERHLFPLRKGLPLMALALAGALALGTALAAWGGRLPERPAGSGPARLAEARVWVVLRGRWQYRGTVGAAVLDGDGLSVYVMKRRVGHLPAGELHAVRRDIGRFGSTSFAFERDGMRIRFTPAAPERWAAALGR
jgi:hypothetical protein